jgi:hypothetical protein
VHDPRAPVDGGRPDPSPEPHPTAPGGAPAVADLPAERLDDQRDRSELRDRYYGLLQELRVVLPGVQVLVAFLLTVPFSTRFDDLDDLGVATYLVALVAAVAATVLCVGPTVYHRAGGRTARSARLVWAVRMTRAGLALLAVSLLSAVFCVTRFVTTDRLAGWVSAGLAVLLVSSWVALPLMTANQRHHSALAMPARAEHGGRPPSGPAQRR